MRIKMLTAVALLSFIFFTTNTLFPQTRPRVTAYYAGWMQGQYNDGYMTAQNIDYSAVTQIIHFSLVPNSDGTLDYAGNSITTTNSTELISSAHAAGVKVIICIGGWGSDTGFRGATSVTNLSTFVSNIVSFIQSRGYDGVDIDWETLEATDAAQYSAFIIALRSALDKISPRPLLSAATAWQPEIFGPLSDYFDEIDIMTYDMAGAWPGWVTWHNAPIFDGGITFPGTSKLVPSINSMVSTFEASGVPASKLGIGIDFYGYIWSGGDGTPTGGATAPDQAWTTAPSVQSNVPYYSIMDTYYQQQYTKFDNAANASYLSIDNQGSANDKFISYDNEEAIQKKFDYVKSQGLGGTILWELGGGYRANMPAGQRDLLLQAVKKAANGITTDLGQSDALPDKFTLKQNYPNPFNPSTTIEFSVVSSAHVTLEIYNILGQKVTTLINENLGSGVHRIQWDASGFASGIYIYRLMSGNNVVLQKKMTLLK